MSKKEGEVREVPFLRNDMKDPSATTGRPHNEADAPGKADSEWAEQGEPQKPKGNVTVNVDDAQLDNTAANQVRP